MIDSITRTPCIVIVVKDNFFDDMVTSLSQIVARNAFVVLLTNCRNSIDISKIEYVVDLPEEGLMSSFYGVFAGQLIAYYIAIIKGFNPDKPRHLSKELTTK
jgi:glucosamine--fructose-6-phosphate aminotransferase (isomerizing)